MNKTFNINLGGFPFSIDEDAFDYIQAYLVSIRTHFSSSLGCEEILYDIEVRMAELFQEHLKGKVIVSMKEVDEVVSIMGKPEDFGAEPLQEPYQFKTNRNRSERIRVGKRLYRDGEEKVLGGVCAGIAAYLGIYDPIWVRIAFVIMSFFGFGIMGYIILWFIMPEAVTSSDKLAMRGEPATVSNIAKMVEEELTSLGHKLNEWGKDFGTDRKN